MAKPISIDPRTVGRVAAAGQMKGPGRPMGRPTDQTCQKCGATFKWERSSHGDGWVMRLVSGAERCDCGYGKRGTPRRS
jgi:hypothetical protein